MGDRIWECVLVKEVSVVGKCGSCMGIVLIYWGSRI